MLRRPRAASPYAGGARRAPRGHHPAGRGTPSNDRARHFLEAVAEELDGRSPQVTLHVVGADAPPAPGPLPRLPARPAALDRPRRRLHAALSARRRAMWGPPQQAARSTWPAAAPWSRPGGHARTRGGRGLAGGPRGGRRARAFAAALRAAVDARGGLEAVARRVGERLRWDASRPRSPRCSGRRPPAAAELAARRATTVIAFRSRRGRAARGVARRSGAEHVALAQHPGGPARQCGRVPAGTRRTRRSEQRARRTAAAHERLAQRQGAGSNRQSMSMLLGTA